MSQYKIIRWDVVTDCNGVLRPMIYFKPDINIVLQLQNNSNYLYLNINNAQSYSGIMQPALVDTASQQPNFRPNFYEACHLYCATLIENVWNGFPSIVSYGSFSVYTKPIIPSCLRDQTQPIAQPIAQPILQNRTSAIIRDSDRDSHRDSDRDSDRDSR